METRQQKFPIHFAAAKAAQWHAYQSVSRSNVAPTQSAADDRTAQMFYQAALRAVEGTVS